MDHSVLSYIRQRSDEELDQLLDYFLQKQDEPLYRHYTLLAVDVLRERKMPLPHDLPENLEEYRNYPDAAARM